MNFITPSSLSFPTPAGAGSAVPTLSARHAVAVTGPQTSGGGVVIPAGQSLLIGLTLLSLTGLVWQTVRPTPFHFGGLVVDRLSAVLALLVSGIGAVTFSFAVPYLAGERRRGRFLGWLLFTVAAACLLMLSTNLLVLLAAWSLTSFGLHRLLTHYHERAEGVKAARKKFVISRLGDLALVSAIAVIWFGIGVIDLADLAARLPASGAAVQWATILVVIAALTKSAQFPFHSWLPETMEAPTPVSALMHAGIINAGGALLVRFAPLLVKSPTAMLLLSAVGTLTVCLGLISMWAQVKVKRTLAWSTVAQMGFMMVQCGLAAFPAAALHIVAHGCYKAWSFLRSGEVQPTAAKPAASPGWSFVGLVGGTIIAVPLIAGAAWLTGYSPLHTPGEAALTAIVALSVGQLWAVVLGVKSRHGVIQGIGRVAGLSVLLVLACFGLYRAAAWFLSPVLGDLQMPRNTLAWVAAALPVAAIVILTILNAILPMLQKTSVGKTLRVHALHGFYFGVLADRVVAAIWKTFTKKGAAHA